MSNPSSLNLGSGTPIPQPNIVTKTWTRTKAWTCETASSLGKLPGRLLITDPLNNVIDHSQHTIQQLTQPNGAFATQLQQTVEQALIQQPPQEILQLQDLINKILKAPTDTTLEKIKQIHERMQFLAQDDWALLKQLAPKLDDEGIQFFHDMMQFFQSYAESTDAPAVVLQAFKGMVLNQDVKGGLQKFHALFSEILNKNQGALIKVQLSIHPNEVDGQWRIRRPIRRTTDRPGTSSSHNST